MYMKLVEQKRNKVLGLGLQIAESLELEILEGELKGGQQLAEQECQNRFGVSRSPVREAFRELEKKGLVEIIPRKGTFVKQTTRKDIEENFPVRAALEGLAARSAAGYMGPEEHESLRSILQKMKQAVDRGDTESYFHSHQMFHELFISHSQNQLLESMLFSLRTRNIWHRFSYKYYQEDLLKSYKPHEAIYEAFVMPDINPDRVAALVEDHIIIALSRFLSYLDSEFPGKDDLLL